MSDVSDIQSLANSLKDFSICMMAFNINQASLGVALDTVGKVTNNFMTKPDKVNATQ